MTNQKPSTDDEAKLALMAYDAAMLMQSDAVRGGIMPTDVSRNFAMQAAIEAVDHFRKTGERVVYCDPEDPLMGKP